MTTRLTRWLNDQKTGVDDMTGTKTPRQLFKPALIV